MKKTILILISICFLSVSINGQTGVNDTTIYDMTDTMVGKPRWLACDTIMSEGLAQDCWYMHWGNFLNDNLEYPGTCMSYTGKVWVEFIIESDGNISNIKILKGVAAALDEEVIRVIKLLPKFIPAKQNGETVRYKHRVPINFTLR